MGCDNCASSVFRQKLGRCKRCMGMLAVLCLLGWPLWWWHFAGTPGRVTAVALLFFCVVWTVLLGAHLLVWGWLTLSGGHGRS